jgi:hypothetical protein
MSATAKVGVAFLVHACVLIAVYLHLETPRLHTELQKLIALMIALSGLVVTLPLNAVIAYQVPSLILRLLCVLVLGAAFIVVFLGTGFFGGNISLILAGLAGSFVHQLFPVRNPESTQEHDFYSR